MPTLPEQDPIDRTVLFMRNQTYCILYLSLTFQGHSIPFLINTPGAPATTYN